MVDMDNVHAEDEVYAEAGVGETPVSVGTPRQGLETSCRKNLTTGGVGHFQLAKTLGEGASGMMQSGLATMDGSMNTVWDDAVWNGTMKTMNTVVKILLSTITIEFRA